MITEPLMRLDELSVRLTCLANTFSALNLALESREDVQLPRYTFTEPSAQLNQFCTVLREIVEAMFEEQRTATT